MAALVLTALSISPVLKDADQSTCTILVSSNLIHCIAVSLLQPLRARYPFITYLPFSTWRRFFSLRFFFIRAVIALILV